MKRRILSILLLAALVIGLLPQGTLSVSAYSETDIAYPVEGGNLYFDKETGTITDCDNSVTGADIPAEIDGAAVTSIGSNAFKDCGNLISVTLPKSVTSIGDNAFSGCTYLSSTCDGVQGVIIPANVTSIGSLALFGCECLQSVYFEGDAPEIGENVFTIKDPDSLWVDDIYVEYINIPGLTLYYIDGCTGWSFETWNGYHTMLWSGDPMNPEYPPLEPTEPTEPEGFTAYPVEGGKLYFYSADGTIVDCDETVTYADVPAEIDGIAVTGIGSSAFEYCISLTGVTIPESVTSIDSYAFEGCESLQSACFLGDAPALGTDVFCMEKFVFDSDFGVDTETVVIPGLTLYYIDGKADWTTPTWNGYPTATWDGVNVPEPADEIAYPVEGGNLYFRKSTGEIFDCDETITKADIPTEIDGVAVTSIGDQAFYYCNSLTSVTISEGVTSIGNSAFKNCSSLTSMTIPEGVSSIGSSAFSYCSSLTSVTIPGSVTSVYPGVFNGCSSLTAIHVAERNTAYTSEDGILFNNDKTVLHTYPAGKEESEYIIPEGVSRIGNYAFDYCSSLISIKIPDSVTDISSCAFSHCDNLSTITIPNSVTSMNTYAFSHCSSLWHVHFLGDMPTFGVYTFDNCSDALMLCILEDAQGWENCTYATELWDYTRTTDCGSFIYTCNICGEVYSCADEDAHAWVPNEDTSIQPTCTESGSMAFTCAVCGATKTEEIAPLGHQQGELVNETEIYWEYACLNGAHTIILYKDSRFYAMQLEGVTAAIAEEESYPWVFSENDSTVGCNAIKSSNQGVASSISAATITFTSEYDFTLAFDYMVSSERYYDKLTISLDGTMIVDAVSGTQTNSYNAELTAGTHTLSLSYSKDAVGNNGTDSGYLYNITAKMIIPCEHGSLTAQEPLAATCVAEGHIACWFCPECGKYFSDAEATVELEEENIIIAALGHIDENNDKQCDRCGAYLGPYVLATELKDGDEVIIYNPGHGKAIKNENQNNWYLTAQEVTPADNRIVTEDTTIVWKVTKNEDGTYTFTNGENAITAWFSGVYIELTNDANYDGGDTKWNVTTCNAETNTFFISSSSISTSYGFGYIECYSNSVVERISCYGNSNPTETDYGFQFYVKSGEAAHVHTWDEGTVTKEATCTETGEMTFTCTECGASKVDEIAATGHTEVIDAAVPATCTEAGKTEGKHCTVCGTVIVAQETAAALGHDYGDWTQTKAPTCTEKGKEKRVCSRCDAFETREIAAHGHTEAVDAAIPATCTEAGKTEGKHCTICGTVIVAQKAVPALGHSYKDGVCTACGAKDPDDQPAEPVVFTDVAEKAWYHDAVEYAVTNGLMKGVGNGKFDPEGSMTRAMLVTVLWRYEGEPAEGENIFTDVPNGTWYTDAVAWAAANGIVGGVGNNKFDPEGKITREQMATILFRYAQKKGIDTSKRGELSGFPDSGKVSSWAKEAMRWAVAEGIINGSDGKLLPQGNATRAQVATLLMRFINQIEADADPTEPTDSPTEPTESPTEPTESPTEPTESPADPPVDPKHIVTAGTRKLYIGMSFEDLLEYAGEAEEILPTTSGYTWYVYGTKDYTDYAMAGVYENKVVAICASGAGFSYRGCTANGSVAEAEEGDTYHITILKDKNDNSAVYGILLTDDQFRVQYAATKEALAGESRVAFHMANAFRVLHGVGILTWCDKAATAARLHSEDMATQNYVSHTSADGRLFYMRLRENGVLYSTCAENLCAGYYNGIGANNAWVNSAQHRANLLNANMDRCGIGFGYGADSDYRYYAVADYYQAR